MLDAGASGQSYDSSQALEKLCQDYWPPVYAWIRRRGQSHEEAEDLTQEFFASLLHYDSLASVDRARGRFRSFMLASLKNFLLNQHKRATAQKRGGGKQIVSMDATPEWQWEQLAEEREANPEEAYDRHWVKTLLNRVVNRLRNEFESVGQGERFQVLKMYLLAGEASLPYAEAAETLNSSESAVKSAIYKLRQRYREMIRSEVAQTLSDPTQVDDEIRHLMRAFGK